MSHALSQFHSKQSDSFYWRAEEREKITWIFFSFFSSQITQKHTHIHPHTKGKKPNTLLYVRDFFSSSLQLDHFQFVFHQNPKCLRVRAHPLKSCNFTFVRLLSFLSTSNHMLNVSKMKGVRWLGGKQGHSQCVCVFKIDWVKKWAIGRNGKKATYFFRRKEETGHHQQSLFLLNCSQRWTDTGRLTNVFLRVPLGKLPHMIWSNLFELEEKKKYVRPHRPQ